MFNICHIDSYWLLLSARNSVLSDWSSRHSPVPASTDSPLMISTNMPSLSFPDACPDQLLSGSNGSVRINLSNPPWSHGFPGLMTWMMREYPHGNLQMENRWYFHPHLVHCFAHWSYQSLCASAHLAHGAHQVLTREKNVHTAGEVVITWRHGKHRQGTMNFWVVDSGDGDFHVRLTL